MKGVTVTLINLTQDGTDAFNRPIYEETETQVSNVLIAPLSDDEVLQTLNLTGRRARYQLGIPKDDTNTWKAGGYVEFFGERWRIIGEPTEGLEHLIPLSWNKKVKVERVNGES